MTIRLVLIFTLLLAAAAVIAQSPLAGAGSPALDRERIESHGWVVTPAMGPNAAAVLHLPPRLDQSADAGSGVTDGMIRQAAMFPKTPVALAAWDHRVYMVFAPEEARRGALQRQVLATGVVRGPIGGHWVPETEGQRLPALPSLPGDGQLLGVAGAARGPAALLERTGDGQSSYQLLLLIGSAWREAALPEDFGEQMQLAGSSARLGLVSCNEGLGVWIASPQAQVTGVWVGEVTTGDAIKIDWKWRPLRFIAGDGSPAPLPASPLFSLAGQYSYVAPARGGTGVEVWALASGSMADEATGGAWRLAHLPDVTAEWAAAPLNAGGRVAVVWAERIAGRAPRAGRARTQDPDGDPQESPQTQEIRRFIAEVSVYTGAVLYEGPVIVRGPMSAHELRLLALVVVALMAVIVIFILRPEPKGPPLTLPAGYALAEPGRRIAASLVDVLAAAFIASQLMNVGLWDLLTLRGVLLPGGVGLGVILAMLGVGFVMTTLGEALAGRSLGKFITGCEVVRPIIERTAEGQIVPSVQLPGLWRAAVRNVVKWTLPPVAMAGLGTPERRHRGDIAAGTAVVIRIEEPEPA